MPKKVLVIVVAAVVVIGGFLLLKPKSASPWDKIPSYRPHLDHASFFPDPIASGQEATKQCLACHPDSSKEVMATAHFQWLGDTMQNPRTGQEIKVGKKNLINNFCIGIDGNWPSCTRCHAGYGWSDDKYDFDEQSGIFTGAAHHLAKSAKHKLNPLQQVTYAGLLNVLFPLQVLTGALLWIGGVATQVLAPIGGLSIIGPVHNVGSWLFLTFIVVLVYLTTTGHTPSALTKAMVSGWEMLEEEAE